MTWKGVVLAFVIAIVVLVGGAWLFLKAGMAPVSTAAAPLPFERTIARMALHAAIDRHAPDKSPVEATEANLLEGAKDYREHCAICHGLPGEATTPLRQGMFPKPPNLLEGTGVTDDPVGNTFWVTKNGIRLSGMPAWDKAMNDDEIWKISELLAHADKLPESVKQALQKRPM